jgi:hypothetical protein
MTLKVYFYRRYTSCILTFLVHLAILRNAVLLQVWPGIHSGVYYNLVAIGIVKRQERTPLYPRGHRIEVSVG